MTFERISHDIQTQIREWLGLHDVCKTQIVADGFMGNHVLYIQVPLDTRSPEHAFESAKKFIDAVENSEMVRVKTSRISEELAKAKAIVEQLTRIEEAVKALNPGVTE